MNWFKKYFWVILSVGIIVLDQITKFIVSHTMSLYDEIVVIPNFFSIFYVRNEGVAFGLLSNFGNLSKIIVAFLTLTIVIVAVAALLRGKFQNKFGIISAAMIIGGGIGNLIDRVVLRYVVDFFAFTFKGWQFAVFNVADIFVTVGTLLLLIYLLFMHKDKKAEESVDAAALD